MPHLVEPSLFRTEAVQGCPVPAELTTQVMGGRSRRCCWVSAPTGQGSAGNSGSSAAKYQVQATRTPEILHRGTWKTGVFLMLRGRRK